MLLLDLGNTLVAPGLDLGDAGIDLRSLLAFRDRDLVFEALQRLLAGFLIHVGDDVLGKIKHSVQVAAGDIQQHTHLRRNTARVPNVRHRRSKRNMTHALAAHGRAGYFNTALFTSDAFIAGVFVLAAVTLPVTGRSKNRFTEQTILLRAQAAIVDGFRFQHLAVRPRHDGLRGGKADTERSQSLGFHWILSYKKIEFDSSPLCVACRPRVSETNKCKRFEYSLKRLLVYGSFYTSNSSIIWILDA